MNALTLTPPPATLIQSDRLTANTKHTALLTVYTLQDGSIQQKHVCVRAHIHTCVCRHSTQIFPVLMTCLTESVLVPYRFFSNSPDSISFPETQKQLISHQQEVKDLQTPRASQAAV